MGTQSEFIFRKVVSFDPNKPDFPPHGLVNVYERETDRHVGQLHPARDGGYMLRNCDGVNLADLDSGRTPGWVALSREPAARLLRVYADKQAERFATRIGTVSEGCPNTWHNTADYRGKTACPECPSQPGLKLAVDAIQKLIETNPSSDITAANVQVMLEDLIYVDQDALMAADCPKTGRSASVCEDPTHVTCPDLRSQP